ncbi:MAG: protocatechuate 3,4-dioxygenase subunit alpha [Dongiaceae bacterium]
MPGQSPSQTVGPFFHDALSWHGAEALVRPDTRGERIAIVGRILDGDGQPVPDALIEIWQANAAGRYAHPEDTQDKPPDSAFHGFGRCASGRDGAFRFSTIRPGRVRGRGNNLQAPHINVGLFARGLLRRLVTRIYFEDAAENADDPVLALVTDPARRSTLLAKRVDGAGAVYRFDIVLQGEDETVFFEC